MMKERWVAAAFTSDALVAELLLRLKQSSPSDSSHAPQPPTTATTSTTTASLNPIGWGDRKSRSKQSTTATTAVTNGFGKGPQQRSPSTPLSWSGGGAPSTSDGYDESSRLSDLYCRDRSVKIEGSTTSIDNKSRKRKIDLHGNLEKDDDQILQISCKVQSEITIQMRPFVLPDLNETPAYEELAGP